MVSLGVTNELTAAQMLAPNGTQTLAMAFPGDGVPWRWRSGRTREKSIMRRRRPTP
jgi:hypothetical protein